MSLRILIASAPPWAATGYGQQVASLIPRLQKDGHQVAMLPLGGYGGGSTRIADVDYFPPATSDRGGNESVEAYAKAWEADVVLTLTDVWILTGYGAGKFRWIPWVPVDGDPMSPSGLINLQAAWRTLSMSRHGEAELNRCGQENTYIPHGFEEEVFFPDLKAGRAFRDEFFKIDEKPIDKDGFVFGSVGLNYVFPGRKGHDRLLEAFGRFARDKDGVYLYIHCDPRPQNSFDLLALAEMFGVKDKVIWPKPVTFEIGYTPTAMRAMYNALDCHVLATHGEGFGLPVLESLACGVPNIATDCTSMRELIQDTINGSLVPPATRYMNAGHYYHYMIDIGQLTEALEDAYHEEFFPGVMGNASGKAGMTRAARFPNLKMIARKTVEMYGWNNVYSQFWRPFLEDCEKEIRAKTPNVRSRSGGSITLMDDRVRKTDGPTANVEASYAVLAELDHPNIIKPLGCGVDEWGRFYYEMPRYPHTLSDFKEFTQEQADRILAGVRAGLDYLHSRGLAHRDMHEDNVLLDADMNPVIIDFGWMAKLGDKAQDADYRPWLVREHLTPRSQLGNVAGYHRIVAYVRGYDLRESEATALKDIPYQMVDGVGERSTVERWGQIAPDVHGKSVLDLGCNLGQFAALSMHFGAKLALGIDKDPATIEAAKKLYPEVNFRVGDITNGVLGVDPADEEHLESMIAAHFDVAFLLSVLQHLGPMAQTVLDRTRALADTVYVEVPEGVVDLTEAKIIGRSERDRVIARFG